MSRPTILNTLPSFRGWTKPGPLPAPAEPPSVEDDESVDALCGHFRIWQLKDGHRFSTDDILTAWYGTVCAPSPSRALDLGSGLGSVAMTAAWRLRHLPFVTVEAQDRSFALAQKSVAYNGLSERFDMRHGDFRSDVLKEHETFDLIFGSPPYWPPENGVLSEHPQKVACRFELRGDVADYARTAAAHLAPGGLFACVFPADQRDRVEAAAKSAELTIVRRKAIHFREGDPPRIDLYAMHRTADLPPNFQTHVEEPLTIRRLDGSVDPAYAAIKLSFGFPP